MKYNKPIITVLATMALTGCSCSPPELQTHSGSFEIAEQQVVEVCSAMSNGQTLTLEFKADNSLQFNLHYHDKEKVYYPITLQTVGKLESSISIDASQDYCLMWQATGRASQVHYSYSLSL